MNTKSEISESETNDIGFKSAPIPSVESPGKDTQRLISEIHYLDIHELKAHPLNAEIYGSTPDEVLLRNIKDNGVLQPLLATWENVVLGGHQRLACARLAGLSQVPVVQTDSTDEHDMIEVLLDSNVQRTKSNLVLVREIEVRMEIEQAKAAKRRATATEGKHGGQFDPAKSPERIGDARDIVARKTGIGGKMVDEALKVMKTIAALKVSGDDKGVEALLDTLEKRTIHAAAKKAKEWEKSQSQLPANPAGVTADAILDIGDADNDAVGDVGSSPLTKGDVITRLDRDLRRYLENLELGQLLEFENDLATFKESWRQGHPSQNDKADCGAGGVAK